MVLAAVTMSCFGCFNEQDRKTSIQGTLYTDSTLSATIPDATLTVTAAPDGPLATMKTDTEGRFGLSWWSNGVDKQVPEGAKFQYHNPPFWICYKGDTLFAGEQGHNYKNQELYPGKAWEVRWK